MAEDSKFDGTMTPEQVLRIGEIDAKFESPIALSLGITKETILPSLEWHHAQTKARIMKITNSSDTGFYIHNNNPQIYMARPVWSESPHLGASLVIKPVVILSAKWFQGRPYVTKGPFSDLYAFSQIHFHWGKNDFEGSEHVVDGSSMPLEIHAMFFKTKYFTHDQAMKHLDGVAILSSFVKIYDKENLKLKPIIDNFDKIRLPYTSYNLDPLSLEDIFPLITDDYVMYWGNVIQQHKVLWLISRQPLTISSNQMKKFRMILNDKKSLLVSNFRQIKSLNNRNIFHVNPSEDRSQFLHSLPHERVVTATDSKKSIKRKSVKSKKSIRKSVKRQSTKRKSSVKKKLDVNYVTEIETDEAINIEKQEIQNAYETKLKLLENILDEKMGEMKKDDDNKVPMLDKIQSFLKNLNLDVKRPNSTPSVEQERNTLMKQVLENIDKKQVLKLENKPKRPNTSGFAKIKNDDRKPRKSTIKEIFENKQPLDLIRPRIFTPRKSPEIKKANKPIWKY